MKMSWLCIGLFFCAPMALAQVPVSSPKNLPPELPISTSSGPPALPAPTFIPATAPTPVTAIPVAKPSVPVEAPVQPSFVNPNGVSARMQNAADGVLNLIENPDQIRKAIEQAPKTVPKQFQKAKEQVLNINQDPNEFNGSNFEKLKWRSSLMFPSDQLSKLYNAARGLTDQSVGAVALEVKVPRVAPAFFLNSVLYNKPDNWTIWMNSRRIRNGAKFPELEIASVNQDSVEFIWETEQLDFISPEWEKKVMPIEIKPGQELPRFVYQSKDGSIGVDRSRRYVRFVLGPHQTFVSRNMKIVEGYVKSTVFDTTQQAAVAAGTTTPPAPGQVQISAPTTPAAIPEATRKRLQSPIMLGPIVK